MKNYYEILEVNKKASKDVIEKAYKVLIKKYHPDLYSGEKKQYAENKTKEINEAYDILSNEFLKEQYDMELENQKNAQRQENINDNQEIQDEIIKEKKEKKKSKVGTLESITNLTKNLFQLIKNEEKREELKEVTQKDIIALILTIIVIIIIGIILWFIPFTNGWMRGLLFENPLFNWIASLFQ